MTTPVAIRPATPADDAALAALDQRIWSWLSTPAPAPAARDPVLRRPQRSPRTSSSRRPAARSSGYVQIGRADARARPTRHVLMVRGLAVDPDRRGAGIGRALVDAAVARGAAPAARAA